MESSHSATAGTATPQVAGHRIKSFEPTPLDSALMSPRRLGPRRSTFNYFEDTVETARLHNTPAIIHAASDREGSERCDQWPAAHELATTHDDDRASIASRCSGPASKMSLASYPATA